MAQRIAARSVWTVFTALILAVLAALGFRRGKAAAAGVRVGEARVWATPVVPAQAAAPVVRRAWPAGVRSAALPPTIKQRIRAEAHGKSPSVRRSAAGATAGARVGVLSAGEGGAAGSDAVAGASGEVPAVRWSSAVRARQEGFARAA
ncbi:hypothetical protein C0216_30005 [Streptomyces globosus]|uniref:Uncharacterized protein n=1 Tax=Streptomyces globosus TaxID=68209 RepID=A0A344U864_9ACTN|nr:MULTISPECIES: DUF6344 domain-containing protein [Streptomyces]AXE27085.1 hypothetical protein C0216_30005 [Streptomyces globosus]